LVLDNYIIYKILWKKLLIGFWKKSKTVRERKN
jgi:hypothetical protein